MELVELKQRLGLNEDDTSVDSRLQFALEDAIDFVNRNCNQTFIEMPSAAKRVIAKFVQFELQGNNGIKSESMDGMSQTFESSEERNRALITELSRAGLRKIRFIPL